MAKPGAALLFDIDGTLADTDAFHIDAVNQVFAPYGHAFDRERYNREIQGFTMLDIAQRFLPGETEARQREVIAEKEAIFRDLARSEIQPVRGLLALMDQADSLSIPMAAVTNAPRVNAEMILSGLGVTHRFKALICGEELPEGKPHPLPYLEGLKALGADPGVSVAFEDSRSGIRSATAAGIASIGIATGLDHASIMAAGAVASARDYTMPEVGLWIERRLGVALAR